MLTPMHVQYLIGLCCLRRNPKAVDVTLGDLVQDDSTGTRRDVDVTVTITSADGLREAIAGFEVKKESRPLDVTDVEQLIIKMNDMPSLTHRSIVSASGYSSNCQGKANKHNVILYDLAPWELPVQQSFPNSHLDGTPANSILFTGCQLVWLDGVSVKINPSDPCRKLWVSLPDQQSILGADGKPLGTCDDFVRRALAQAAAQLAKSPEIEAVYLAPRTTPPNEQSDGPVGHPVPVENLLLRIDQPIFVSVEDRLIRIEDVAVSGKVQWMQVRQYGTFHIMRRHDDPASVYAGAAVCEVPNHEGVLLASLLSPDDTKMAIHLIRLSESHKHMIRGLKLRYTSNNA
jgi:hypothetical protein